MLSERHGGVCARQFSCGELGGNHRCGGACLAVRQVTLLYLIATMCSACTLPWTTGRAIDRFGLRRDPSPADSPAPALALHRCRRVLGAAQALDCAWR